MLNYLSLEKDIKDLDLLIEASKENRFISDEMLKDLKSTAIKAARNEKGGIKSLISLLDSFNGFNTQEYLKLLNAKGSLVTRQKDILYQSSNAILAEDLAILLKFIINTLAQRYDIKFDNEDDLANPSYWKYEFNRQRGSET